MLQEIRESKTYAKTKNNPVQPRSTSQAHVAGITFVVSLQDGIFNRCHINNHTVVQQRYILRTTLVIICPDITEQRSPSSTQFSIICQQKPNYTASSIQKCNNPHSRPSAVPRTISYIGTVGAGSCHLPVPRCPPRMGISVP